MTDFDNKTYVAVFDQFEVFKIYDNDDDDNEEEEEKELECYEDWHSIGVDAAVCVSVRDDTDGQESFLKLDILTHVGFVPIYSFWSHTSCLNRYIHTAGCL